MTDRDPTPVAGEPVEPTDSEIDSLYGSNLSTVDDDENDGHFKGLRAVLNLGRAFERITRERKRGERPTHGELMVLVHARLAGAHELDGTSGYAIAFEAGVAFADSGDSDELAKLRADNDAWQSRAQNAEATIAGLRPHIDALETRMAGLITGRNTLRADRNEAMKKRAELTGELFDAKEEIARLSGQYEQQRERGNLLEAERDAEKARADRAEVAAHETWRLIKPLDADAPTYIIEGGVFQWKRLVDIATNVAARLTQAKARIAELEAALHKRCEIAEARTEALEKRLADLEMKQARGGPGFIASGG